jgi:transposase-like protein
LKRSETAQKPLTIAEARERCDGVQVHCLRCAHMAVVALDRFDKGERIPEIAQRRRFRCRRCGGSWVETRPNYRPAAGPASWYGLTPRGGD